MGSNIRKHDPRSPGGGAPGGGAAVTLSTLDPGTAAVGGPNINLDVHGSGFTADSVIYFNNVATATMLVSTTTVSTTVSPSAATGPATVPVWVQNGAAKSNSLNFTFVAP